MNIKIFKIVILAIALGGLLACNKRGNRTGSETGGVGDTTQFYGSNLTAEDEKQLLTRGTYYFGYDNFEVRDEDMPSIYSHAKHLMETSRARIRVEGHTDERGSREYNIALGEKRARAVANILMLKGASQDQISVVSYGKEKPAVPGHDEYAWSQNRRAVIVYEID